MSFSTKIGQYEVLKSEVINVFRYEEVTIAYGESSPKMKFRIKFLNDGGSEQISTDVDEAANELIITIANMFDSPGTMVNPIEIATAKDGSHRIYFMASITPFDKSQGYLRLFYNILML